MATNTSQIFPKLGVLASEIVQITAASSTPTDVMDSETDGRIIYGFQLCVPNDSTRNVIIVSLHDNVASYDVDYIPVPERSVDLGADPPILPWTHFYAPRWMQAINLETGGVAGFILPLNCKIQMRLQFNDTLNVTPIVASLLA